MKQEMQLFNLTENTSPNIIKSREALKTVTPTSVEAYVFSAAGLFVTKLRTRLNEKTHYLNKAVAELGQRFRVKQCLMYPPSPCSRKFRHNKKKQSHVEKLSLFLTHVNDKPESY
ncbi:UNVERIFIED_CONTAM: hypothetical protein NCL1_24992 [Trichonephila clavipes]